MAKQREKQGEPQRQGTATPAIRALQRAGVAHVLHPYETGGGDPATGNGPGARRGARTGREGGYGMEAAAALGIEPERIFKTLLVDCAETSASNRSLAVAIVPVATQLDLKAFATALGVKRTQIADAADAERATGYVVGGISPLGQKRRLPTVLDESAMRLETLYVSAGRRGLQVELAPAGLIELTSAVTAPIATH